MGEIKKIKEESQPQKNLGLPMGLFKSPADAKPADIRLAQTVEVRVYEEVKDKLSLNEKKAFEKLVLPYLNEKPAFDEFQYPDIEEDRALLKERQELAIKKDTREIKTNYIRAKIFEALLGHLLELYWLPDTFLTETSDFDDWINGTDAVLEAGNFKAAIDFTSQKDKDRVHDKLIKVFKKIDTGRLGEAKYFKSQADKTKSYPVLMPAIIIGLSERTVSGLLDIYISGNKKELEGHPVRHAIAEEIIAQIRAYKSYINNPARASYKPDIAKKMTANYDYLGRVAEKMQSKSSPGGERDTVVRGEPGEAPWRGDSVYQTLMAAIAV
jgi:hypothetical protein